MSGLRLSEKQQQFVIEYIDCGDAQLAATRAGYGRNIQHRAEVLMSNPYIVREIARQQRLLEQAPVIKGWYDYLQARKRGEHD